MKDILDKNFFQDMANTPSSELPDLPNDLKLPVIYYRHKEKTFTNQVIVFLKKSLALYTINHQVASLKTGLRYPNIDKCQFSAKVALPKEATVNILY